MIHRTSEKIICNPHMRKHYLAPASRYKVPLNAVVHRGNSSTRCGVTGNSKKTYFVQKWSKWGSNPRTFTRSRIIYCVAVPREVIPFRV